MEACRASRAERYLWTDHPDRKLNPIRLQRFQLLTLHGCVRSEQHHATRQPRLHPAAPTLHDPSETIDIMHHNTQEYTLALPHCMTPCEVVRITHLDSQEFALALPAVQDDGQAPRIGPQQVLRHLLQGGELVSAAPGHDRCGTCRQLHGVPCQGSGA